MNIYDLIFMACLSMNQGAQCKQEMLTCVLEQRNAEVKTYMDKTDFKKLSPEDYVNKQPTVDWQAWALDCAVKQKAKKK